MTEPTPPPDADPVDLAASAALDGEPGPAAGTGPLDPAVARRVEEFRAVSAAVAADVTPPSRSVRDAQIAAALDTLVVPGPGDETEMASPTGTETSTEAVAVGSATGSAVSLDERRRSRRRGRWLAVAAAVVAIALAIPIVRSLGSRTSSSQDTATATAASTPAESSSRGAADASSPEQLDGAGGAVSSTTAAPTGQSEQTPTDANASDGLGEVASADELTAAVRALDPARFSAATSSPQTDSGDAPPSTTLGATTSTAVAPSLLTYVSHCQGAIQAADPTLGDLALSTSANLAGSPVDVLVFTDGAAPSGYRLLVADQGDCRILLDRAL